MHILFYNTLNDKIQQFRNLSFYIFLRLTGGDAVHLNKHGASLSASTSQT